MKKLVVILLMLAYGFSSSGATLQLHYCCGKLKSIEWAPVESKKDCGMGHKMGSKPCCETKEFSNKEKADQLLLQLAVKNFNAPAIAERPSFQVEDSTPALKSLSPVAFSLPPPDTSRIYLLNRVFRI
jgi:hypothetical protein